MLNKKENNSNSNDLKSNEDKLTDLERQNQQLKNEIENLKIQNGKIHFYKFILNSFLDFPFDYTVNVNDSTSISLSSKGNVITVNIIDETDINNSVMEYQKEFEGKYNFSKRNYQTEHNNSIIHTTVIKDNDIQINRFYFRKNNTSYLIQTGVLNQEKEMVINNIIDSL